MTIPVIGISVWQALLIEAITTGVLMLLVCAVWDPRSGNGDCGSLKFLVMIFLTSVVVVSIHLFFLVFLLSRKCSSISIYNEIRIWSLYFFNLKFI